MAKAMTKQSSNVFAKPDGDAAWQIDDCLGKSAKTAKRSFCKVNNLFTLLIKNIERHHKYYSNLPQVRKPAATRQHPK